MPSRGGGGTGGPLSPVALENGRRVPITSSVNETGRFLGKRPPRVDVRTLRLGRYLDSAALPAPPPTLALEGLVSRWPMYANDRIGDCTCAAAGHMIEVWTTQAGHLDTPTEQQVLSAFDKVKLVGSDGEEGAVELDVLKYWRDTGVGGHTIAAFGALNRDDHTQVRTAANLFSGAYLGLALPASAQDQDVWDFRSYSGDGAPGSWGGHAVNVVGYDAQTLTFVTWGALKQMTWRFWDAYCDEAYALLTHDWFDGTRTAPNGFDLQTLEQDLRQVTAD